MNNNAQRLKVNTEINIKDVVVEDVELYGRKSTVNILQLFCVLVCIKV